MHYWRRRKYGSYDLPPKQCADCGIDIRVKHGESNRAKYCDACRYKRRHPRVEHPSGVRAVAAMGVCINCGRKTPTLEQGVSHYCCDACKTSYCRYGMPRPSTATCADCGCLIDLRKRDRNGDFVYRRNARRCRECQCHKRPHRYGVGVERIARRDGTICKWCGEPVDMSLVGSGSKWAPSIDHIIPWSRGGTNAPKNLCLMHRVCNAQKGTTTFAA